LFLDTANLNEMAELLPLGIFYGVTTNPLLLERAKVPCSHHALQDLAATAFALGSKEFMCQTWGTKVDELVDNGIRLANLDSRVVVKVPLTFAGIEAASMMSNLGIRVCTTACYSPHQVITSVSAGAEYVAPYLGRMNDAGRDGMQSVVDMQKIVDGMRSKTRVLVASIRDADQLAVLAARGCNTFTISPKVARLLTEDELTMDAATDFAKVEEGGFGSS
ncbi:hypothetical protein GUITHDRAFT_78789, partial [Guillardia theta CCMP2712]